MKDSMPGIALVIIGTALAVSSFCISPMNPIYLMIGFGALFWGVLGMLCIDEVEQNKK